MRILLGSIIALSCLLISHEIYLTKKMVLLVINEMIVVTQKLMTYLGYGSYDVYTMCELAFSDAEYFVIPKQTDTDFPTLWKTICLQAPDNEASRIFFEIGLYLGGSDVETQMSRLEYTLESLVKERDRIDAKLVTDKKLIYSLGCFVGIALGLMLI